MYLSTYAFYFGKVFTFDHARGGRNNEPSACRPVFGDNANDKYTALGSRGKRFIITPY